MTSPSATKTHRIALQAWGSDGDIHPFIVLAGALAARGHAVTLAITSAERKSYQRFAKRGGFRLIEAGFVTDSDAQMHALTRQMYQLTDPIKQAAFVFDGLMTPSLARVFAAAQTLCASHDLLIGHFILHPVHAAAEMARCPYLTLTLNPSAIPTASCPPVGAPDLGRWGNRLSWLLASRILEVVIGNRINRWRQSVGLAPLASYRQVWESPAGNLIAVSPEIFPQPPDWSANQHLCGFFPSPEAVDQQEVTSALDAFIAAGAPPVYMTFGSMLAIAQPVETMEESISLLENAVRLCGCRAIIQGPWSRLPARQDETAIFRLERSDHRQVFPRCSAIVHHGGAGTTQTALLCGKASVVVAHIADQYFWGRELARLGIAPPTLERRKLKPEQLAKNLGSVLTSQDMQDRAARIGQRVRREDGLGVAVGIIESVLAKLVAKQ